MRKGLVLEGGGMRSLFSAGVIDVMMEQGLQFDSIVGVSAGAAFGCNYKSRQIGRAIRYNKLLAGNWRNCSIRSLLLTGNLIGAEFAYHYVPTYVDIFDTEAFEANPLKFYAVTTNIETGEPIYKSLEHGDYDDLEWLRASASLPLCSTIVELDGLKMLDGGIVDSIPLKFMENQGITDNIVVLTRPKGYRKKPTSVMPLIKLKYWKYPKLVEAMANRHLMYNRQLEYLEEAERAGRVKVIYPPCDLPIDRLGKDPEQMQQTYDIGRQTATDILAANPLQ